MQKFKTRYGGLFSCARFPPSLGTSAADIAEPGTSPVGCSKIVELIRAEMSDSLVHAERYGWGV